MSELLDKILHKLFLSCAILFLWIATIGDLMDRKHISRERGFNMYRGFPAIRLGITIIVNSVMPRYPIKKAISTKRMKLMTGNIGSVPNVLKILAACLRKQLNSLTEPSMTGVQYPSESEKGSNRFT